MKRIISIMLFLTIVQFFSFPLLYAQESVSQKYLFSGKGGIYAEGYQLALKKGIKFSLINSVEIQSRSSASGKWKTGASEKIPLSFEVFVKNFRNIEKDFPMLSHRDANELKLIWNDYQKYLSTDSLSFRLLQFGLPSRLALGITVRYPIKKANTLYYKIIVYDKHKQPLATGAETQVSYPASVQLAHLTYFNKKVIKNGLELRWKVQKNQYAGNYFALFRQKQHQGNFDKVDFTHWVDYRPDGGYVELYDSLLKSAPYAKYYVVSIDPYFNKGSVSDTVFVSNSNRRTFPKPENFSLNVDKKTGAVYLKWKILRPSLVRTVDIYRGRFFNQPFDRIASVSSSDSAYEDKNVKTGDRYYYFIQTTGFLNEKSLPTVKVYAYSESTKEPIRPANVLGKSIRGGALIQWQAENNFVKGYYVFRNIGETDSLFKISPLILNKDSIVQFADTGKLLSPKWFYSYAVKAVSQNNVESNFSDTVRIRPGIIPKAPEPYGLEVLKKGENIWIGWQNMLAHDNTISGYLIFRVNKATSDTVLLKNRISAHVNYFTDSTADITESYIYGLISKNIFGGKSDTASITYEGKIIRPSAPLNLSYVFDKENLELNWDPVFTRTLSGYKIFRYQRGKRPVEVGKTDNKHTSLVLPMPTKGLWFFYVESYNQHFSSSASEEIHVNVQ